MRTIKYTAQFKRDYNSKDIKNRLQHLAHRTGRTKTYYAREAILRFIEDMEDEHLALSRLETPTKRWSLDEFEQGVDGPV